MSKVLFVFFLLITAPLSLLSSECEKFHSAYVKPLSIDGHVKTKAADENYYIITIENPDKKLVLLKLLKNNTTKELYSFIEYTTKIIKKPDSVYTRVIKFYPNNTAIDVRHFENLCD
jgi:hypothetical protein